MIGGAMKLRSASAILLLALPLAAQLLSKTLAEEEIADSWLTEVARELMTEARTGDVKPRVKRRTSTRGAKP
jgi:hypothetical protein